MKDLSGHMASVVAVYFSPDGATLATIAGRQGNLEKEYRSGEVFIRLPETGEIANKIPVHPNDCSALAFSPDSRLLAIGLQVWKESKGAEPRSDNLVVL